MRVEVVYALADVQDLVVLDLPDGAVARDAVAASGLGAAPFRLAVYGKKVSPDCPLRDGDRVEILRPLAPDPNEARRRRARRGR